MHDIQQIEWARTTRETEIFLLELHVSQNFFYLKKQIYWILSGHVSGRSARIDIRYVLNTLNINTFPFFKYMGFIAGDAILSENIDFSFIHSKPKVPLVVPMK